VFTGSIRSRGGGCATSIPLFTPGAQPPPKATCISCVLIVWPPFISSGESAWKPEKRPSAAEFGSAGIYGSAEAVPVAARIPFVRVLLRIFELRPPCTFALPCHVDYDSRPTPMTDTDLLRCDGCGQAAPPGHITKRLQRLEWTTRYRPIHVGSVLLGSYAPKEDAEFLYAESGGFVGEAKHVLAATGVAPAGKSWRTVLTEFQRGGFLLTYALECPIDPSVGEAAVQALLEARLPALLARIRRSMKPKRIVPISGFLEPLLGSMREDDTGCPVILDDGKAFALDGVGRDEAAERLREILSATASSH
jgi:hypothetical protein